MPCSRCWGLDGNKNECMLTVCSLIDNGLGLAGEELEISNTPTFVGCALVDGRCDEDSRSSIRAIQRDIHIHDLLVPIVVTLAANIRWEPGDHLEVLSPDEYSVDVHLRLLVVPAINLPELQSHSDGVMSGQVRELFRQRRSGSEDVETTEDGNTGAIRRRIRSSFHLPALCATSWVHEVLLS